MNDINEKIINKYSQELAQTKYNEIRLLTMLEEKELEIKSLQAEIEELKAEPKQLEEITED